MENNKILKDNIKIKKDSTIIEKTLFSGDIYNWLKSVNISCKRSTYSNYEYTAYSHIIPEFGKYKRNQLNKEIINEFTNKLLKNGYEPKTIKDILIILKQILRYIDISIDITMPKIRKKEVQILTKEHQKKLENYLSKNINIDTFGIFLSLYTGMRIGEICGLRWKDIDLEKSIIHIKKTLIRVKNEEIKAGKKTIVILDDPKSISSKRNLPIPSFIVPILKELKQNSSNETYFLTGDITFIEPRNYLNHYKKIMKQLNINKYNFHALRHTFATRCIEIGCDPKTLSEILGHANVRITLERYVHPNFENKIKMMNNLNPMCTFNL